MRVNPNPIRLCPEKRGDLDTPGEEGGDGEWQGGIRELTCTHDCWQHGSWGRQEGPFARGFGGHGVLLTP